MLSFKPPFKRPLDRLALFVELQLALAGSGESCLHGLCVVWATIPVQAALTKNLPAVDRLTLAKTEALKVYREMPRGLRAYRWAASRPQSKV